MGLNGIKYSTQMFKVFISIFIPPMVLLLHSWGWYFSVKDKFQNNLVSHIPKNAAFSFLQVL